MNWPRFIALSLALGLHGGVLYAFMAHPGPSAFAAGNGSDKFRDAFHAGVPFFVKLFGIDLQPGLNRREATDYFFFADFHRTANGSFIGTAVAQRCLD